MSSDLGAGGLGDEASDGDGGGMAGTAARAVRAGDRRGHSHRGAAARADRRFVSLKEATTLRTHDYFPRLPAALWTERGPYVVVIELCVSPEGRVSEAALLSQASARLDPVVLAAVRGWRYRPRFEDGKPSPFCHGVVIKYERSVFENQPVALALPWHFLYFLPLPQGHGSLRPTLGSARRTGRGLAVF